MGRAVVVSEYRLSIFICQRPYYVAPTQTHFIIYAEQHKYSDMLSLDGWEIGLNDVIPEWRLTGEINFYQLTQMQENRNGATTVPSK